MNSPGICPTDIMASYLAPQLQSQPEARTPKGVCAYLQPNIRCPYKSSDYPSNSVGRCKPSKEL